MTIKQDLKSGIVNKNEALGTVRDWLKNEPYNWFQLNKLRKWIEKFTPQQAKSLSKKPEKSNKKKKRVRRAKFD